MSKSTELLARVSIFKGLSPDALTTLSLALKPMTFVKDAVIVGQDDQGDALYIIESGRVKVVLYGESGREMILTIFKPGEFFGEMSLLDGQPRSANVIALQESRVLTLSRDDFVRHLEASPSTALKILGEMSLRLRRADEIIGNLALLDVYGRVARVLIDMARRDGEQTDEGVLIKHRPTQQDLASMIGTSRETVSRVLSEFQRRGFLSMQGKNILVSHGFVDQDVDEITSAARD
jgi:CRP/FNR family transcriptional regulator, cyclic AMP receptor protein